MKRAASATSAANTRASKIFSAVSCFGGGGKFMLCFKSHIFSSVFGNMSDAFAPRIYGTNRKSRALN
jgi:hypothetical protein